MLVERVFLALPRSYDPRSAERAIQTLWHLLAAPGDFPPPPPLSITKSDEFYNSDFARLGSWDAWIHEIVCGVDYQSRHPRFTSIVLTEQGMGKGTMKIVEKCLEVQKPVLLLHDGRLKSISEIEEIDIQNWQAGWRAVVHA